MRIEQIRVNPNQPRKLFRPEEIAELAESIRTYGIINPLTLRDTPSGYELVAGERRLRAAKQAGLDFVPCMILPMTLQDSALVALVENLQRQDLDYFEEALGIRKLMENYQMTQQNVAEKLGKTQSAVANKLRLLRLPEEVMQMLRENGMTERHARALLKLGEPEQQLAALKYVIRYGLNVSQTEAYIERLLAEKPEKKKLKPRILKDVRLFFNTMSRAVETMRMAGIGAEIDKAYEGEDMVVTIRIPAQPQE